LGNFYEAIVELADDYAEAYMGRYQQLKTFPSTYHMPKEPVQYLESLKSFVDEANKDLPKDQELINIVAEIQQLIDSTLYKLRFLK
jgi:Tfp pilus assembly protein PilO